MYISVFNLNKYMEEEKGAIQTVTKDILFRNKFSSNVQMHEKLIEDMSKTVVCHSVAFQINFQVMYSFTLHPLVWQKSNINSWC